MLKRLGGKPVESVELLSFREKLYAAARTAWEKFFTFCLGSQAQFIFRAIVSSRNGEMLI